LLHNPSSFARKAFFMEALLAEVNTQTLSAVIIAAILIGAVMLLAAWQSRTHNPSHPSGGTDEPASR
jgi:hypothetical protein